MWIFSKRNISVLQCWLDLNGFHQNEFALFAIILVANRIVVHPVAKALNLFYSIYVQFRLKPPAQAETILKDFVLLMFSLLFHSQCSICAFYTIQVVNVTDSIITRMADIRPSIPLLVTNITVRSWSHIVFSIKNQSKDSAKSSPLAFHWQCMWREYLMTKSHAL